jgi:hypothetical protein
LADLVLALERLRNVVEAAKRARASRLRVAPNVLALADFESRGSWLDDGALSGSRWVADRTAAPPASCGHGATRARRCGRPPSWTDVHHCQRWEEDGETKVDNGALLCRRHHVFIHAKGWRVTIPKPRGRPEVCRPYGSVHRIERWPKPTKEAG